MVEDFKTEDIEINARREKVLNSKSNAKEKLINSKNIEELTKKVKNMSADEVKNIIDNKISEIKNEELTEEDIEKIECELALFISNLPIDMKNNVEYWKRKEREAKNAK